MAVRIFLILMLFVPSAYAGASRDFDEASTSNLTCGTAIDMAGWTAFTITAWVNWEDGGAGEHTIVSNWNTSQATVLFRLEPADNKLEGFAIREANTQVGGTFTGTTVSADTWTHVAFRYDGSNLETFIDTTKNTTQYAMSTDMDNTSPTGQFAIGYAPHVSADYFDGQIAHVHVFNQGLTDAEIQRVSKHPGSITAGLQAYWPLVGDGATETDQAGSNNCTVNSAAESFTGPALTGAVIHGGTLQ